MTQLNTCNANLETCQTDLAECQVFPGDGVGEPSLSYTDNGNGTVTDNNTLLMWETKVAGGGAETCLTNLHGVDSTCTWAEASGAWIAAINAANLGGHSDWRLPNIKELQSIADYSRVNPAIASGFPGSTAPGSYWSSTIDIPPSTAVWVVHFLDGAVTNGTRAFSLRVRAVRDSR